MFNIAKMQIMTGFRDAKYLIFAVIVLVVFLLNGIVYVERIESGRELWHQAIADSADQIQNESGSLMSLATEVFTVVKPYPLLSFVNDDGQAYMPNSLDVSTFQYRNPRFLGEVNEAIKSLPEIDWSFIIGVLMTLQALVLSFDSICGQKSDGTLAVMMSYSVSRLQILSGIFGGLLVIMTTSLVAGILLNLLVLVFAGVPVFTLELLIPLGWILVVSLLLISLFILIGMTASSLTTRPAIALVLVLVVWMMFIMVIPGTARLVGEQLMPIRSEAQIERDIAEGRDEIFSSAPKGANWYPHEDRIQFIKPRRDTYIKVSDAERRGYRESYQEKIRQTEFITTISSLSPVSLYSNTLQHLTGTGSEGFVHLINSAALYREQLQSFIEAVDAKDSDSLHYVYVTDQGAEGTFSDKSVEPGSVPRWEQFFNKPGLPDLKDLPIILLLIFAGLNLQMAFFAFLAFNRYDPRHGGQ